MRRTATPPIDQADAGQRQQRWLDQRALGHIVPELAELERHRLGYAIKSESNQAARMGQIVAISR